MVGLGNNLEDFSNLDYTVILIWIEASIQYHHRNFSASKDAGKYITRQQELGC